jgi:hypothetical protein
MPIFKIENMKKKWNYLNYLKLSLLFFLYEKNNKDKHSKKIFPPKKKKYKKQKSFIIIYNYFCIGPKFVRIIQFNLKKKKINFSLFFYKNFLKKKKWKVFLIKKTLLNLYIIFLSYPFFFGYKQIKKKKDKKILKTFILNIGKDFIGKKDFEIYLFMIRTKHKGFRMFDIEFFIKTNSNLSNMAKRFDSYYYTGYFTRHGVIKSKEKFKCIITSENYLKKKKNFLFFFFEVFLELPQFFFDMRMYFASSIMFIHETILSIFSNAFIFNFKHSSKPKLNSYFQTFKSLSDNSRIFSWYFFLLMSLPPCTNCPVSHECHPQSLINPYDCVDFRFWSHLIFTNWV